MYKFQCSQCGFAVRMAPDEFPLTCVCGTTYTTAEADPIRPRTIRRPQLPCPKYGPGRELHDVLEELGFRGWKGCGCKAMADKMNCWGVDGCIEHRPEIVARLRKAKDAAGIASLAKAGWKSVMSGLVIQIDWADPIPSLVDIAIARAREKFSPKIPPPPLE